MKSYFNSYFSLIPLCSSLWRSPVGNRQSGFLCVVFLHFSYKQSDIQLLLVMLIAEAFLRQLGIINCIFLQIVFPSIDEVCLVKNGNSDSVAGLPATNKSNPVLKAAKKKTNGPAIGNYRCYCTGYVVELVGGDFIRSTLIFLSI